jgi:hypothetical protein
MVKQVRNANGDIERYSKAKIMRSMMVLGLDRKTARTIIKTVGFHKGMTTSEIRGKVGRALKRIDMELAMRYFTTVDLHLDPSLFGVDGNCLLTKDTMEQLGVSPGETVEAYSGWNKKTLRAYRIEDEHYKGGSIYIGPHDLGFLKVTGNEFVAVRKKAEA